MGQVTRPANEVLELLPCPYCDGDIQARDCGYSAFNPGWVTCSQCHRKWAAGYVSDRWSLGLWWNKRQPKVVEIDELEKRLKELKAS